MKGWCVQIYAEVVGGLSALTAMLYCIPYILRFAVTWVWNFILFILWIVLFGIFGKVCGRRRMRLCSPKPD